MDTSTAATTVALLGPDGACEHGRDDPAPGARPAHASRLLVLVDRVMDQRGASWDDIEKIAVGVGPGGFTGLRIGIASARALAQARRIPLIGVSSLAALARGAASPGRVVTAVIDARRGELFLGAYREGDEVVVSERVIEPAGVAELSGLVGAGALAVGDGALRYRAQLEAAGFEVPSGDAASHLLSAAEICRLAREASGDQAGDVLPHYIRDPDAVPRPR